MPSSDTTFLLPSPNHTAKFGESLGRMLEKGDVVALFGDLGAGKTALTRGIAAGLPVDASVDSPTYLLVQEYPGDVPLFHADLYRIEDPVLLIEMGFEEYFERGGVVVIEWAERAGDLLPEERLEIHLRHLPEAEDTREITLRGFGSRFSRIVDFLRTETP